MGLFKQANPIARLNEKTNVVSKNIGDFITFFEETVDEAQGIVSEAEMYKKQLQSTIDANKKAQTFCENILKAGGVKK